MSGLRVVSSSDCYNKAKKKYNDNIFGYVSTRLPFCILIHNKDGSKPKYKDDFAKLPITKKNEVIRYFSEHPKSEKVYFIDPTLPAIQPKYSKSKR